MEYWEREKGLDREILISAVEDALLSAAKRAVGPARELRCEIDRKDGDIRAFAKLIVVENVVNKHDEIAIDTAKRFNPDAQLNEEIELEVTPKNFGRIASQNAKQALMQAIRRAEKALIYSEFHDRIGDIVSGEVRGFDRSDVLIDLGRFEALLPNRERVPTEEYQRGERIRCYVKSVAGGGNGSEIILSRKDPDFVLKLFQLEVSEINDGTIEVKGIAREPGFRTKLAVHSRDDKVDPVGACVGLRGQRVKNIVRELNNEKVDIIKWSDDPKEFVVEALKPAKIKSIEINEADKRVKVTVDEDQLSIAIGKKGQNARLTAKLTGWEVDIEKDASKEQAFESQVTSATEAFKTQLGLDEETAAKLVQNGIPSPQDLVAGGVEADDLVGMLGIDEAKAAEIVERAKGLEAKKAEPAAAATPAAEPAEA